VVDVALLGAGDGLEVAGRAPTPAPLAAPVLKQVDAVEVVGEDP